MCFWRLFRTGFEQYTRHTYNGVTIFDLVSSSSFGEYYKAETFPLRRPHTMPFGALNVASAVATPRHSAKMERLSALADAETAKVTAECRWREWARRGEKKKLNRSSFFAECRGGGRGQRRGRHFHCLMQPLFDRLMRVLMDAKSRYSKKIEIRTPNIPLEPHHMFALHNERHCRPAVESRFS